MIELLLLMNMVRATQLKQSVILTHIAQERAEYLCSHPFSHDSWSQYESKFSLDKYFYAKFKYIGENLAKGFKDEKSINNAFMNSPTHKAVILNEHYQYVGIGNACDITVEEFGGYD